MLIKIFISHRTVRQFHTIPSSPTGHQKNRSLLAAPIRTLYNLKFRLTPSPRSSDFTMANISPEVLPLFKIIQEKFPCKSLGDDRWYLVAVRCMLYKYKHTAKLNLAGLLNWGWKARTRCRSLSLPYSRVRALESRVTTGVNAQVERSTRQMCLNHRCLQAARSYLLHRQSAEAGRQGLLVLTVSI